MRAKNLLPAIGALLLWPSLCLGMGSGPHPSVPYGIPAQVTPVQEVYRPTVRVEIWIAAAGALVGVLIWAVRTNEKIDAGRR